MQHDTIFSIPMKPHKQHLEEVLTKIKQTADVIPAHRKAFRAGFTFSRGAFETQLPVWKHIWSASAGFRTRFHAYLFLEQYVTKKELQSAIWETSAAWQNDIDDWALCDALAKINTKVLEQYPEKVYQQLAAWNKDADLWKRRQSVVSLLYFSRTKKVYLPFKKITALVTPLLADKEYYVQKGVGWTLREMTNVYPDETLPFLQQHIKTISPIAFTIAIEKMDMAQKDALKAIRKR